MIKWLKRLFQKKTTPKLMIEGVEFPEEEIAEVRDFVMRGWVLGERHGLKHWQRVERNGILLSMYKGVVSRNVSIKVVRYFAYLHDSCRLNELEDYRHGQRAAEILADIRHTILKDLDDEEVSLLEMACRSHTSVYRTGILTVDICLDADRLDMDWMGVSPTPLLMATPQGAYYARHMHLIRKMHHKYS